MNAATPGKLASVVRDTSKALCCLLAALLLCSWAQAELPNGKARSGVIAGMKLILKAYDLDHDGRLSRPEIQAMIDRSFARISKTGAKTAQLDEERAWLIEDYAAQDLDHDGYLTLNELLHEPLAEFDCMDRNRDGALTHREIETGMVRCSSGRAYHSSF